MNRQETLQSIADDIQILKAKLNGSIPTALDVFEISERIERHEQHFQSLSAQS